MLITYFVVLSLVLLGGILYRYARGKDDLFTTRNIFIAGFVNFQLSSAVFPLVTGDTGPYHFQNFTYAATVYCGMTVVFLALYAWAYRKGFGINKLSMKTRVSYGDLPDSWLWMIACGSVALGFVFKVAVMVPLVGILTSYVGIGLAAAGAGLAGWAWARNMLNPFSILLIVVILAVAGITAITGEFGRRPLISVCAGFAWGAYFSVWRRLSPTLVLTRLAIISVPFLIGFGLFSSVRTAAEGNRTAEQHLEEIASRGDVLTGLLKSLDGQGAAPISMWLIQDYQPIGDREPDLFRTLKYAVYLPVPRDLWPGKPEPLSRELPYMANIRGVAKGVHTQGPGLMGHIAADYLPLALIVYPLLFGALHRYADNLVRLNPHSPLAVVPIGCCLGQLFGLPRGETSVFLFIYFFSTINVIIIYRVVGALAGLPRPVRAIDAYNLDLAQAETLEAAAHEETADTGRAYPGYEAYDQAS